MLMTLGSVDLYKSGVNAVVTIPTDVRFVLSISLNVDRRAARSLDCGMRMMPELLMRTI